MKWWDEELTPFEVECKGQNAYKTGKKCMVIGIFGLLFMFFICLISLCVGGEFISPLIFYLEDYEFAGLFVFIAYVGIAIGTYGIPLYLHGILWFTLGRIAVNTEKSSSDKKDSANNKSKTNNAESTNKKETKIDYNPKVEKSSVVEDINIPMNAKENEEWVDLDTTSITLPDGKTSIDYGEYEGLTGLASVTIPISVTRIGNSAFSDCTSLTSIIYQGTKAQWIAITKGYNWNYGTGNYTIHCTNGDISK